MSPNTDVERLALLGSPRLPRLDFAAINAAALRILPELLTRWAPEGE